MLEEPTSPTTGRPGANKTVLRVAWFVIGAGVLVAMSAAVAGGINPNANVLPIRNLAAAIMLVGLIAVLAAYRAAWLQSVWDKSTRATTVSQSPPQDDAAPRRQSDATLALAIIFLILLSLAFFITALLCLAGGAVAAYATLGLRTMLAVVMLSLVVYGRGYLRAFCLGAIIPTGLQALSSVVLMLPVLQPFTRRPSNWLHWQDNLASLLLLVTLAGAAGVVAMVVRFLVERLQGPDRPP